MQIPVFWNLRGSVNSSDFTLEGQGTADLETGATVLHLTAAPKLPNGFDPAVSQFICNFALAGYTAVSEVPVSFRDAVAGELFVRPAREVKILDASGEQIVRLEALTTMRVARDSIVVTNYMSGFSRLPAPVVRACGEETLVPAGPGAATGLAHFQVEIENGAVLEGLTVVPYRFDRQHLQVTPAVRSIRDQVCEWASASEVTLEATSQWREMSLAMNNR